MSIECPECGFAYNKDDAMKCKECDEFIQPITDLCKSQTHQIVKREPSGITPQPPSNLIKEDSRQIYRNGLEGRISQVKRNEELPPIHICKILSIILMILVVVLMALMVVPMALMVVPMALMKLMAVPAIQDIIIGLVLLLVLLSFIGFRLGSMLSFFNPFNIIFAIFTFTMQLIMRSVGNRDRRIPVFRGMIETSDGNEHHFVFRGPFQVGNLVESHYVILKGKWKKSNFIASRGKDKTTCNSAIISKYRNPNTWPVVLIFMLSLILFLFLSSPMSSQIKSITGL